MRFGSDGFLRTKLVCVCYWRVANFCFELYATYVEVVSKMARILGFPVSSSRNQPSASPIYPKKKKNKENDDRNDEFSA